VDGRSDVFSLGVVLYELLVGRRPFHADSQDELCELIASREPKPPRQWDETVPREAERICLKALAKRAADRYTTAKDMADDLRHLLATAVGERGVSTPCAATPALTPTGGLHPPLACAPDTASPTTPIADSQPIKIVPKGLRSFDAH